MGAIGPVKDSVTAINMACQKIVQSGSVPGSEQICAQIVGLANQLLPMAVQQMSQGGMMGQGQGPGAPIPPPPGAGPAPMPGMGQ
jgi:hypothetical protein